MGLQPLSRAELTGRHKPVCGWSVRQEIPSDSFCTGWSWIRQTQVSKSPSPTCCVILGRCLNLSDVWILHWLRSYLLHRAILGSQPSPLSLWSSEVRQMGRVQRGDISMHTQLWVSWALSEAEIESSITLFPILLSHIALCSHVIHQQYLSVSAQTIWPHALLCILATPSQVQSPIIIPKDN